MLLQLICQLTSASPNLLSRRWASFSLPFDRDAPEVRGLIVLELSTGPRRQHGAPATRRVRTNGDRHLRHSTGERMPEQLPQPAPCLPRYRRRAVTRERPGRRASTPGSAWLVCRERSQGALPRSETDISCFLSETISGLGSSSVARLLGSVTDRSGTWGSIVVGR